MISNIGSVMSLQLFLLFEMMMKIQLRLLTSLFSCFFIAIIVSSYYPSLHFHNVAKTIFFNFQRTGRTWQKRRSILSLPICSAICQPKGIPPKMYAHSLINKNLMDLRSMVNILYNNNLNHHSVANFLFVGSSTSSKILRYYVLNMNRIFTSLVYRFLESWCGKVSRSIQLWLDKLVLCAMSINS